MLVVRGWQGCVSIWIERANFPFSEEGLKMYGYRGVIFLGLMILATQSSHAQTISQQEKICEDENNMI